MCNYDSGFSLSAGRNPSEPSLGLRLSNLERPSFGIVVTYEESFSPPKPKSRHSARLLINACVSRAQGGSSITIRLSCCAEFRSTGGSPDM